MFGVIMASTATPADTIDLGAICETAAAPATVIHPQTLMVLNLSDDILPARHGYPFKIRIPTKLGSKKRKFVATIYATRQQSNGFWTDRGYRWFSRI